MQAKRTSLSDEVLKKLGCFLIRRPVEQTLKFVDDKYPSRQYGACAIAKIPYVRDVVLRGQLCPGSHFPVEVAKSCQSESSVAVARHNGGVRQRLVVFIIDDERHEVAAFFEVEEEQLKLFSRVSSRHRIDHDFQQVGLTRACPPADENILDVRHGVAQDELGPLRPFLAHRYRQAVLACLR